MIMGLLVVFILIMFISSFMPSMVDAVTSVTGMSAGATVLVDQTILFLIVIMLVVIVKVMSDKSL